MSQKGLQKSSWAEAVFSTLIILILLHLLYAAWLHGYGGNLDYQIKATRMISGLTPEWVIRALRGGGYGSTLTAGIVIVSNNVLFLLAGVVAGFLAMLQYLRWKTKSEFVPVRQPNIYGGESTSIYVTLPALGTGSPIVEHFLRLDRNKLTTNRPPRNDIEKLELTIQEILAAHREWPADPVGHHANVPLYEHSIQVSRKMQEKVDDPLARTIGLAHDIGKLIAYKKDPKKHGAWVTVTKTHDQMSANIVRLLPEFKALSNENQETLKTVLKYYHNPQSAPARTSQRSRMLIQKLRFADSIVAFTNQQQPKDLVGDDVVVNAVTTAILEVIPTLNINRVRSDVNADGFTGVAFDYVAVMEYPIRLGLASHIKGDHIVRALALRSDRQRGQVHPASDVIFKALKNTGLLITTYNGTTPDLARFTVSSGTQTYSDCYLLKRSELEKLFPVEIEHWGEKPPYKLGIKGGTRGSAGTSHDGVLKTTS